MKNFNKKSSKEACTEMDKLLDAIKADPFNFQVALTYGAEPLDQIRRCLARNDNDAFLENKKDRENIIKQIEPALKNLDIHLRASEEILRLYKTHYMPMTYGGCVDVGAMIKEDFEKRFKVLEEAAIAGRQLLDRLMSLDKDLSGAAEKTAKDLDALKKGNMFDRYKLKPRDKP